MAQEIPSCVIVGGGPAGAAAGRLLASWGHRVTLFDKASDPGRALAESIPPSTQKLLHQIGVADAVARAGFLRNNGNTVWWASRDRRLESFADTDSDGGYQVFRPAFDRVLLAAAAEAGVDVRRAVGVRRIDLQQEEARIEYTDTQPQVVECRYVLDCSGRAGLIARRHRVAEPGFRTCALVGVWRRDQDASDWGLPDASHTAVETFADGWAWSVPTSGSVRHMGVMVGRALDAADSERTLAAAYRQGLAKTSELQRLARGAHLERLWACDASLYWSSAFAGPNHLLVGDAGSFIDPLSSYGVKKALASAWMAAIAVHTALTHPDRAAIAFDFFAAWERNVYATHRRQTQEFARAAAAQHDHPFWRDRATASPDDDLEAAAGDDLPGASLTQDPAVQRAFATVKAAPQLNLVFSASAPIEQRPVVRGNEIVLEPALTGGLRFVANVDLLKLAQMAPHHTQVPDLFEAYCRTCSPVPLPSVVGGLSLLVARGILHERV